MQCDACGKTSYSTLRQTIRVLLRCLKVRGGELRYYRCPRGHGWHLTSKTHQGVA